MAGASGAIASATAVRRLRRDLESFHKSKNAQIAVQPSEDNLLEWHFALHSLPADTPFAVGCYHGKILFPANYPHEPPALVMVTQSGRLETGRRLCLSMTDFHPESWNPAWSVETILVGLLSFFTSGESGYGAIHDVSNEKRRQLAADSWAANAQDDTFRALFPGLVERPQSPSSTVHTESISGELDAPEERPADIVAAGTGEGVPLLAAPEDAPGDTTRVPLLLAPADPSVPAVGTDSSRHSTSPTSVAPEATHVLAEESRQHDGENQVSDEGGLDSGSDNEEPTECWICRDTSSNEPLIQPCGCRGSMSGVHASCVEQWISHHRRNAVNDEEAPRCSVCHQEFRNGYERRPGVADFVRHHCYDAAHQLLRTVVLVILLVGYQGAAQPDTMAGLKLPLAIRVLFIALFAVVSLHKVLVLTVSLPPHRPPPANPNIRRFFVTDYRSLALHIAEAFATIMILGFWWLVGALRWPYIVPFMLLGLIPVVKCSCSSQPSGQCIKKALMTSLFIVLFPLVIPVLIGAGIVYVVRHPWQFIHPLDAGPHIIVAIASVPLCLICESNVPIVSLWWTHSALMVVGLLELFVVRKWQWREGRKWWFALQLTALVAYVANALCVFREGIGGKSPDTDAVVSCTSCLWLVLVGSMTVKTNWGLVLRYYRTWQHRNGNFTFQVTGPRVGVASEQREASVAPDSIV